MKLLILALAIAASTASVPPVKARGWLGFGFTLHADAKDPSLRWLYVRHVHHGSPAESAGLRVQDMILAIDRKPVRFASHEVAMQFFAAVKPGRTLRVGLLREGRRLEVTLLARSLPEAFAGAVGDNPRNARILDGKP